MSEAMFTLACLTSGPAASGLNLVRTHFNANFPGCRYLWGDSVREKVPRKQHEAV